MKNIDITKIIRQALPIDSFPFNPSIAHITGDTYLLAVRSFVAKKGEPIPNERNNSKNPQHPWFSKWKGEHDVTYILPIVIIGDSVQPIKQDIYPIKIEAQDARIFKFYKEGATVSYIITFNRSYNGRNDLLIKGGDTCDDYCYIIDWSYLVLDINTLEYTNIPGELPLCLNISNQIEKNWSLWNFEEDNLIHLILSYSLTPIHTAFSFNLTDIKNGKIQATTACKMLTQRPKSQGDFLDRLQDYYQKQLFVSLSTPAYQINSTTWQAVGHIKIKLEYLRKKLPLKSKLLHPTFVYFMFIYQFEKGETKTDNLENMSHPIDLTDTNRLNVEIKRITPAFIVQKEYMLNFPAGLVMDGDNVIISYGNGDREAHLFKMSQEEIDKMILDISTLELSEFKFIILE